MPLAYKYIQIGEGVPTMPHLCHAYVERIANGLIERCAMVWSKIFMQDNMYDTFKDKHT